MNRVWKIQNSNLIQQVAIRFPKSSIGTTSFTDYDDCAEYVIIFANDPNFTTNVIINTLTQDPSNTNYEAEYIFPVGASYFTFGKVKPFNQGNVMLPTVLTQTDTFINTCNTNEMKYFRNELDLTKKLMGLKGYTDNELSSMELTILPTGANFDNGIIKTRLMPRITYAYNPLVTTNAGTVRIYYSAAEMAATNINGAITNSWFFYNGSNTDVIADISNSGKFDGRQAQALTPDATGVEDGISYVEFDNITNFGSFVHISSNIPIFEVLPVKLLGFNVELRNHQVYLNWNTASEQNNKGFTVQRSTNATKWTDIGFVNTKANDGNSSTQLDYEIIDYNPFVGKNYYRIKQIDISGVEDYSPIRFITINQQKQNINLYPNPASSTLFVEGLYSEQNVSVVNTIGVIMNVAIKREDNQKLSINLEHLAPSLYFLIVTDTSTNSINS